MLEKLAKKRKLIALVYGAILLILFLLHILLGNAEDKIMIIAATVIGLPLFYFGVRLICKIVRANASPRIMLLASWFFLIFSVVGILTSVPGYVFYFPNGFTPSFSCLMGVVLGILTDVEKHMEEK